MAGLGHHGVGDLQWLDNINPARNPYFAASNAAALGIPSEEEYVAQYCQRMGMDKIDNWSFYMAFSFFRLAAICQGVAKRAADGNASSKSASGVAHMVQPLAAHAVGFISG